MGKKIGVIGSQFGLNTACINGKQYRTTDGGKLELKKSIKADNNGKTDKVYRRG